MNESLKVILGTTYMIMFVLAFLAYITLARLTIGIPYKLDLNIRYEPQIRTVYDESLIDPEEGPPFRLVAYVDTERQNPTVTFFIESTASDRQMWNMIAHRVFGGKRAGTIRYMQDGVVIWDYPGAIEWREPDELLLDGRPIKVDEEGELVAGDSANNASPTITTHPNINISPPELATSAT
jgi:hypothetical protein